MIDYVFDDGGCTGKPLKWGSDRARALAIISCDKSYKIWSIRIRNVHERYQFHHILDEAPRRKRVQLLYKMTNEIFRDAGLARLLQYHHDKKPPFTEVHELYGDCIVSARAGYGTKRYHAIKGGALRDIKDHRLSRHSAEGEVWFEERKAFDVWIPVGEEVNYIGKPRTQGDSSRS